MPHVFIDDKEERFAKEFVILLQEEMGKKGKEFRIPKSAGRTSVMSNETKQYHPPKGRHVPLNATLSMKIERNSKGEIVSAFYDEGVGAETVTIRYCDKVKKGNKPELNSYSPSHFKQAKTLMPRDYQLYWFLIHSPLVKGGRAEKKNTQGKYNMEIYDAESFFTKEIASKRTEDMVRAMIRNDDTQGGVTLEKLREMAEALFIPATAWTGTNHLRAILLEIIENDQAKPILSGEANLFGWNYGYKLLQGDDENVEKKVQISRAIENGLISCTENPASWFYRDKGTGNLIGKICDIGPHSLSKEQSLLSFLKMNPKEYANFLEVMKVSNISTTVAVNNKENLLKMIEGAKEEERHQDVLNLYDSLIALTKAPAYRTAKARYAEAHDLVQEPKTEPTTV